MQNGLATTPGAAGPTHLTDPGRQAVLGAHHLRHAGGGWIAGVSASSKAAVSSGGQQVQAPACPYVQSRPGCTLEHGGTHLARRLYKRVGIQHIWPILVPAAGTSVRPFSTHPRGNDATFCQAPQQMLALAESSWQAPQHASNSGTSFLVRLPRCGGDASNVPALAPQPIPAHSSASQNTACCAAHHPQAWPPTYLSSTARSFSVPVFSALTEYSAMLRSGRAATFGREGMPASMGKGSHTVRGVRHGAADSARHGAARMGWCMLLAAVHPEGAQQATHAAIAQPEPTCRCQQLLLNQVHAPGQQVHCPHRAATLRVGQVRVRQGSLSGGDRQRKNRRGSRPPPAAPCSS